MDVLITTLPIVFSAGLPPREHVIVGGIQTVMERSLFDTGRHHISDTTVLKLGAEVPRRARIYLLESRGKRRVAVTTSDDQGRYTFAYLPLREYDLIAEDIAGTYRSVIANNVLPVPML